MIFTIGAYIWRAARRRGWKDRLGRVLISIGYLIIGYGISKAIHAGVNMFGARSEGDRERVTMEVALNFMGFGFVGALLVWIGVKMAKEIIITTAYGSVSS